MNQTYQEVKSDIIDYLTERGIEYNDNKPEKEGGRVTAIINGINVSYSITSKCMRLPIEIFEGHEAIYQTVFEALNSAFPEDPVKKNKFWIDVKCEPSIDNYAHLISNIEDLDLDIPLEHIDFLDDFVQRRNATLESGATFEGTIFERTKERGSTIGGRFGKMVCDASGMDLFHMFAEEYYESGEIDGIEKDPITNKPISIFECQSGIHKGEFLDDNHLNKTLGKYLYDPEIIPTVRKVVILAGGYSREHLTIIKERSNELKMREIPIEVILLKTIRDEDEIRIVRIEY